MKLLTIVIPCYNSENYMKKAVESALIGGEETEILIVDDGSTDATAELADDYATRFPSIIKAIHKENGGHGDAVMTGLKNATGLYFKVLDSDDWLDSEALPKVLALLRETVREGKSIDLLVTNFIYEKVGKRQKTVVHFRGAMPEDRTIGWDEMKKLGRFQYILMHAALYRTEVLRESGLNLPKHTFYVDNLYVFQPMPYVHTLRYLDVALYHYFIGRDDQSVNVDVMLSRYDQQVYVNRLMIDYLSVHHPEDPMQYEYMLHYLNIVLCVSSVLAFVSKDEALYAKKDALWDYFGQKDPASYDRLMHSLLGKGVNLPHGNAKGLVVFLYKIVQKCVGFN